MKSVSLTLNRKDSKTYSEIANDRHKMQIDTMGSHFGVKEHLGFVSAGHVYQRYHHPMIIDNNRTNESLLQFSYRTLDHNAGSVINKTPNVFKTANVKVGRHLKGQAKCPGMVYPMLLMLGPTW